MRLKSVPITVPENAQMALKSPLLKSNRVWLKLLPVLEGVESGGDALDPPMSILVGIKDKLDGSFHLELLLQSKQMLLPGTATLGEQQQLPTGIYLQIRREPKIKSISCKTLAGQKKWSHHKLNQHGSHYQSRL